MRAFASLFVTLFIALLLAACGGGSSPAPGATPDPVPPAPNTDIAFDSLPDGSFSLTLLNNTNGRKRDDEIYITITAFNHQTGGDVIYVRPSGQQVIGTRQDGSEGVVGMAGVVALSDVANNSARCDASTKTCYVNYAFTLADLGSTRTLVIPGNSGPDRKGSSDTGYHGARIWVSMDQPLLQQATYDSVNDLHNITQPDVIGNPADPNRLTVFDWFEFAYQPDAGVPFGGNVTQVDLFAIPMTFTVTGAKGTTKDRGIALGPDFPTRDDLLQRYRDTVSSQFRGLVQTDGERLLRLVAPYYGANFQAGGSDEHYFDLYVDFVWATFTSSPAALDFYDQPPVNGVQVGNRFYGCQPAQMQADKLCFMYASADKQVDSGPWYMSKPTTVHVFQNGGELQPGCFSVAAYNECNAFGAQLAAALNRGIAHDPAHWHSAADFYKGLTKNDWAQFWHSVSLHGLAYGMGFDDTADQSSVAILPTDENISSLVIGIGW